MPSRQRRVPIKTVETLKHEEATRKNIPTAEYQPVLEKKEQVPVTSWSRNAYRGDRFQAR
jgi:adenine-specific DNA-methyltransferase